MMASEQEVSSFLGYYNATVYEHAMEVRKVILKALPGVGEKIDMPARILAYTYGKKYAEAVCALIPSQKGLKLGFNRAVELSDPEKLFQGSGKVHRYIVIGGMDTIKSKGLTDMLAVAYAAYLKRMKQMK